MTQVEVAKLVAVLIAAFPSTKASGDTSKIYERMLRDLDCEQAGAAVQRLLASAKFMPTIAEIREAVLVSERGPKRAGGDAWGDVLAAVHRFGSYRTPTFTDPTVAHAVAALGWSEICLSENQAADRARFIELYDKLQATERAELQVPADVRRLPHVREQRALPIESALKSLIGEPASADDWAEISKRVPR